MNFRLFYGYEVSHINHILLIHLLHRIRLSKGSDNVLFKGSFLIYGIRCRINLLLFVYLIFYLFLYNGNLHMLYMLLSSFKKLLTLRNACNEFLVVIFVGRCRADLRVSCNIMSFRRDVSGLKALLNHCGLLTFDSSIT